MKLNFRSQKSILLWQALFILLSTTWLWAPQLNHLFSDRTALISQYESPGAPYSWLFRLGDIAGATLLILIGRSYIKNFGRKDVGWLLAVIGLGMFIDPLIPTTCTLDNGVCQEYFSFNYLVHAIETLITGTALLVLSIYDAWLRRRLVSVGFVFFQFLYFGLFMTQLATQHRFNTLSQYIYQLALIVWLAWFCRDFIESNISQPVNDRETRSVRQLAAVWAFINGIIAMLISLAHLNLLGRIKGVYFAGDSAWLAQHGVVVGVVMLYLSRHLLRGEQRARQIFLLVLGVETLKYAVVTPHALLMTLYLLGFVGLFIARSSFSLGIVPLTWRVRFKDLAFMLAALSATAMLGLSILYNSHKNSSVITKSLENFSDYVLQTRTLDKPEVQSALLAHTISAFLLVSLAVTLWILFRPYKPLTTRTTDYSRVRDLLQKYSASSEDYFKVWPKDKRYFWNKRKDGFIVYKIAGPIAFALADPIAAKNKRQELIQEFIAWCRRHRLRACFMPIYGQSQNLYRAADMGELQIGASALINIDKFLGTTANNKWWRWKKNRAEKSDYEYGISVPPHSRELMKQLRQVSDNWLRFGAHRERGFAMGYFDDTYINECSVHYLRDQSGKVVAFTNQLPIFKTSEAVTIDLFRYRQKARDSMPYLLLKTMEELSKNKDYKYFDLGFVPFTDSRDALVRLASVASRGIFSARGLEQFKNKFDPDWRPNYLAYDGDLADMALVAMYIEPLMKT